MSETTLKIIVDKTDKAKERKKPEIVYDFGNGQREFKDPGKNGGPYKQN